MFDLIKLEPLNFEELELKIIEKNNPNLLLNEIDTIIRYEIYLENLKSEYKDKISKYELFFKDTGKRINISINQLKKKAKKYYLENKKEFKKVNHLTGEVKTIIDRHIPNCFGIINEKDKYKINKDFDFPKKYYVLDEKMVFNDVREGKLSNNAIKIIKSNDFKITWLPKNFIREDNKLKKRGE